MKRYIFKGSPISFLGRGRALLLCAVVTGAAMTALGGCNTLQAIEVSRGPARTTYGQGQELDASGLAVMAHYKKNSEYIADASHLQITGYDRGRPGRQTVTVVMDGKTASFTVTVVPALSLSIQQPPVAVLMQGDDLNLTGLAAWVEFENQTVPGESIGPDRLDIFGYNRDRAGVQTLTADYYGKRASFSVTVAALTGIAVKSPPARTEYFMGEDFNPAGLVVIGTWEGMGEKPVNAAVSEFDTTRAGEQHITVSYSDKTARFPVRLIALDALSVDRPPAKTDYRIGDDLDLSGIRVQGTWPGSSLALVDPLRLKVTGYDKFRMGEQRVTVTIGGKSDAFWVTVTSPFEGIWIGRWGGSDDPKPLRLRISNTVWELTTVDEKGERFIIDGVFRPDSGSRAKLQCDDRTWAGDVEVNSPGEMKISNRKFIALLRKVN